MEPLYMNIKDKAEVIHELGEKAEKAETIYIATDPDREGEAIG
jgi:DNA topoisomerase-1